ncbi:MAG: cysteine--tRNA ligase [Acidobacteria bacterium]|nr:cysteine--tRNA ligase [Acidobacteriota bacterium]
MISFYNTLTRKVEDFKPIEDCKVGMYSCGPTVYDFAHIGNFRANIFVDILKRSLKYFGYEIKHVMNLTDVDDRIIDISLKKEMTIQEYTKPYIEAFFEDLRTLRIQPADVFPKATEHIEDMINMIEALQKNSLTYDRSGSVYYKISNFKNYGELAGIKPEDLKDGARIDTDRYDKDNVQDFALWKAKKLDGEPCWESPFGCGRPGWHLECSAMSIKYLGETFDIHCGGEDLIFPHHQNEIAQSEGATGKRFVNYWLHCAHLQLDGEKMSKSLGNFYTLRDLVAKGYDPIALRYTLLATHYRSPLVFSFETVEQSAAAINRLRDFRRRLEREKPEGGDVNKSSEVLETADKGFNEKLSNDLNISGALGEVFTFVRNINGMLDDRELTEQGRIGALALLCKWDSILDVLKESERGAVDKEYVEEMIAKRIEARKEKNWHEADRIRNELLDDGIILEDTPQGTTWKKK